MDALGNHFYFLVTYGCPVNCIIRSKKAWKIHAFLLIHINKFMLYSIGKSELSYFSTVHVNAHNYSA